MMWPSMNNLYLEILAEFFGNFTDEFPSIICLKDFGSSFFKKQGLQDGIDFVSLLTTKEQHITYSRANRGGLCNLTIITNMKKKIE